MLEPHHRKHLNAGGLSDQNIDENGWYSEIDVSPLINCSESFAQQISPCLVIPFYDLNERNGYCRVRPDNPPIIKGKPAKYLSPKKKSKDEQNRAYFPKAVRELIRSCRYDRIYITEGEKKALAATQNGLPCIGLTGVNCWKIKGKDEPIDDLCIVWQDRTVYICFDSDIAVNDRVQKAESSLAKHLTKCGATVMLLRMPYVEGKKHGIDDYLLEFGKDELLKHFQPYREPSKLTEASTYSTDILTESGRTDNANADRFIDKYHDKLRYVPEWQCWLKWDGKRWRKHEDQFALALARQYAKGLYDSLASTQGAASDTANSVLSFVRSSNQASSIERMLRLATADDRVCVRQPEFDQRPTLFNCQNGTIDLDGMRCDADDWFSPHKPEDNLTQIANVNFDPNANCPNWSEAINLIFDGNRELIAYVQQLFGYCLSGLQSEHLLPIAIGSGCNGKSTLWNTIARLLGDYAYVAASDLLLPAVKGAHPAEKAALYGKRFVAISEPAENGVLNEAKVKELTGGDAINARGMRENFWTFQPTHKFWLSSNHRPRIRATDFGIWRRVKLIPFAVNISERTKPKPDFDKWLVANEGPGILNWMITGFYLWRENGFQEPAVVTNATNAYRMDEDEIGRFVSECCETDDRSEVLSSELFKAYQGFGGNLTQTTFSKRIKERYHAAKATTGAHRLKMVVHGLRLIVPGCSGLSG